MCKKTQFKYCSSTIDKCIRPLIKYLNVLNARTLSCCCGHGKYPMTIIVRPAFENKGGFEVLSKTHIPRDKKFYKRDKEGYYYIPEVINEK